MGEAFRTAAIQTLRHPNMGKVHFRYGPTHVYPNGYRSVASLVEDRHIQFRLTSGNPYFDPTPSRGQRHYWGVSDEVAEADRNGYIRVRGTLSAMTRGTIVHEATHALQDYQRLSVKLGPSFTPEMAEGAAYLAGWIARLEWGYPRLPASGNPRAGSHAFARWLAGSLLDEDFLNLVPSDHVMTLNRLVLTGSHSHYTFEGV